jgi:protein TonB
MMKSRGLVLAAAGALALHGLVFLLPLHLAKPQVIPMQQSLRVMTVMFNRTKDAASLMEQKALLTEQKGLLIKQKAVLKEQKAVSKHQKGSSKQQKAPLIEQKGSLIGQKAISTDQKAISTAGVDAAIRAEASAYASVQAQIQALIQQHLRYPEAARRRGIQGRVALRFSVQPDGAISGATLVQSSGAGLLDKAALSLLQTLPRLDAAGLAAPETFTVNVNYQLH